MFTLEEVIDALTKAAEQVKAMGWDVTTVKVHSIVRWDEQLIIQLRHDDEDGFSILTAEFVR
jgi:pyruvate/2-oxoglutarate/acetoin dehydrogenase E1 component